MTINNGHIALHAECTTSLTRLEHQLFTVGTHPDDKNEKVNCSRIISLKISAEAYLQYCVRRIGLIIALALIVLYSNVSFGQANELRYSLQNLDSIPNAPFIDTVANPNSTWQVGTPRKVIFSTAYKPLYTDTWAIVTDTASTYPTNDTSIFYLWQDIYPDNCYTRMSFAFKIDCDSLNDYGWLEVSPDGGKTWYDLNAVDTLKSSVWGSTFVSDISFVGRQYLSPIESRKFTGTSEQWHSFVLEIPWEVNIGYSPNNIVYKFTFISDDIQTNQEGWMIDHIYFESRCPEDEFYEEHRGNCLKDY